MQKYTQVFINHILTSIDNILAYTAGLSEADFISNKLVQDATIRNLEIIGEATKNIPVSFRNSHNHIPWRKMAGMRDKLIHSYMCVDIWAVWVVVADILPGLRTDLKKLVS